MTAAFDGAGAIIHAGDVGGRHVLGAPAAIAPVHAVYGNNDEKTDTLGLPLRADVVLAAVRFHLVHQLPHATPGPDTRVVVFGHSHRPLVEQRDRVLFVNPGAAGRAGFHRLQAVAVVAASRGLVRGVRIIELGPRVPRQRRGRFPS